MPRTIILILSILLRTVRALGRTRADLVLENLALRQQLAALMLKRQPRLVPADRAFWIALRQTWQHWSDVLVVVKPGTVVAWPNTRRF